MLFCETCRTSILVRSKHETLRHLNDHKKYGKLKLPIKCQQSNTCQTTLLHLKNFIRHLENYHYDGLYSNTVCSESSYCENRGFEEVTTCEDGEKDSVSSWESENEQDDYEAEIFDEETDDLFEDLGTNDFVNDLKQDLFRLIIALRSRNAIPYTSVLTILNYSRTFTDRILNKAVDLLQNFVSTFFPGNDKVESLKLSSQVLSLAAIFQEFSSEFKIERQYAKHPSFVKPESVVIGRRNDSNVMAEYVSIGRTIRALCSDTDFAKLLLSPLKEPSAHGMISSFVDGSRYRLSHHFRSPNANPTLFLQLYADGVALTSSLRGSRLSGTMFYFTILNLYPHFNAAMANMHLVAICNSRDLKEVDGYNCILQCIVDEIKVLERDGLEVEIPNMGTVKYFVTIFQVAADNLALNELFGLVPVFSVDYCCALCYATREDMQNLHYEALFQLRTFEQYVSDLQHVIQHCCLFKGVKRTCALNQLRDFHTTKNWTNDQMHTLVEGIVPYCTNAILYVLSRNIPTLTCEFINYRMRTVLQMLKKARKNSPPALKDIKMGASTFTPSFTAAQTWTFFRYLPLAIGHVIPHESEEWCLFIRLHEIADLVMAPRHSQSSLDFFSDIYGEFLARFKQLFEPLGLNIKPKMHFLVHFSSMVEKNGPAKHYWTMNYERANGVVKLPTHTMRNYRAPCKTLAFKRQCGALHDLLSKNMLRDAIEIKHLAEYRVQDLPECYSTLNFCSISPTVAVSEKVVVNGVVFERNDFVITRRNTENHLEFAKIELIICEKKSTPSFLVSRFDTEEFDVHLYAYNIIRRTPSEHKILQLQDLLDICPLEPIFSDEKTLIRPNYFVI